MQRKLQKKMMEAREETWRIPEVNSVCAGRGMRKCELPAKGILKG